MSTSLEKTGYLAENLTRVGLVDTNATFGKLAAILSKALKIEGNSATAAALNALTNPMPGLLITITTGGTLTLGTLSVSTNDTVYFNGLIWAKAEWAPDLQADIIQIGNDAKTGYNKLTGHTKIDNRPTGGTSDDYAIQVRSESAKTTGMHWGVDAETHLVADGGASLRSVQGVAVVDTGKTLTAGTLNGVYGQVRADGTVAGNSFLAALYGLIEAGAAIVANHVSSLWLDSHQANAVTGKHDLLSMTNNGAAQMDQAIHVYGGDKITALFDLDTVAGMVSDTAETAGTAKKIKITIDGVVHYLNAYTG